MSKFVLYKNIIPTAKITVMICGRGSLTVVLLPFCIGFTIGYYLPGLSICIYYLEIQELCIGPSSGLSLEPFR